MKQIIIIVFVFAFFSCSYKNENTSIKQICINFNEGSNDVFRSSELVDSIYYIVMDSTFLLGDIDEVKVVDNIIYCIDKHNGIISKIDKSGKFIGSFNKSGHAKSEYIKMDDADISQNGELHIYDGTSDRILRYSRYGDYIGSFDLDGFARDFAVLDNGDYIFYIPDYQTRTHCGLWKTDSIGNFKKQLITVDEGFNYGIILPSYINRYDIDLYGLIGGEDKDNIYMVSSDTVMTTLHINFNIEIPKRLQNEMPIDVENYKGQIYFKHSYIESNRWIVFTCNDFDKKITCYYDKKNQKCYKITSPANYVDDMGFIGVSRSDCVYNGRYWLTLLKPNIIKKTESLSRLFPNISENSNPVIRIAVLSE
jgi:hypothetical protein